MVESCRRYKVDTLIATSSASVVMPRSVTAIDGQLGEDMPYPERSDFVDEYAESKARGEKHVLDANGATHYEAETRLRTSVLRPSIIYAADDGKFAERLLQFYLTVTG